MSKSLKIGDLEVKIPVVQGGMGVGISLSRQTKYRWSFPAS